MWNPDLPMKPLLDDFFNGYYGKAAPFVRDWFEAMHKMQQFASSFPNKPLLIFDSVASSVLQDGFLDFAVECWRQAVDAAKDAPETSYNVRMAKFSFDYLRLERINKILYLRPGTENRLREKQTLAKSLLARMDEAKDIRIAETDRGGEVQSWRALANGDMPAAGGTSGEIEELLIGINKRGVWGDFVDDPLAGNGKALKLFNTHFEWCATVKMDKIDFEPGMKYRLSVRVRVDKARPGEAFWAGVYSPVNRKGRGGVEPRTEKVGDGYAWYDVATWVPAPDEYLWIGPGRFNADGKSAINGVYVDKIWIVRVY